MCGRYVLKIEVLQAIKHVEAGVRDNFCTSISVDKGIKRNTSSVPDALETFVDVVNSIGSEAATADGNGKSGALPF